jgi:hypothetical protein
MQKDLLRDCNNHRVDGGMAVFGLQPEWAAFDERAHSGFTRSYSWNSNGANSRKLRRQVRNSWAVSGDTYAVFLRPMLVRAS